MSRLRTVGCRQTGLSYVEVLLAVVLLVLVLGPAMETLQSAFTGATVHQEVVAWQGQLTSRVEDLLAEPHGNLDAAAQAAGSPTTPTTYSDPVATPDRVVVYLSRYDGDNADGDGDPFSDTDEGLLWLRVAMENTPYDLTTLIAR
jgi:hypothetical protein